VFSLLAKLVAVDAHASESFVLQMSEIWQDGQVGRSKGHMGVELTSSSNRSPRKYAQPYRIPLIIRDIPQNMIHQQSLSSSYAMHQPNPVLNEE
jgi:hypothetical protein